MWRRIFVIFSKEVQDNSRDRRSLLVALIYPLLGPLLLGAIIAAVSDVVTVDSKQQFVIHVQGAENGPVLVAHLEKSGATIRPAPTKPVEAVRTGLVDNILVIPPSHADAFARQTTAQVKLIVNSSRLPGLIALNRMTGLLGTFNRDVWGSRIAARGVDYQVLRPLEIRSENVTSGVQIFEILLFMVPPLFIFNLFMGGVYLAVDATSGERERGSLEALLINPVERWGFMTGKFMAALYFTALAVVVQLIAFKLVFMITGPANDAFSETLGLPSMIGVFVMALPLAMFAVGIQFVIATMTRSFKEAQTYLGLLPLIPAIPGMVLVFAPVQAQEWMMAIPIFSQTLLMGQFVRGEEVLAAHMATSMLSSLAVTGVLLFICARLYERENLIFGG